ncbi:protein pinocchio isoform X2 [Diaphorina citri]|uniref:Protein pinocchio isoform X1 n=1 Tax=Diaphorina citri TaxID=121845 RepID=A0A1S3CTV8_DIACI|nr:protein pinocchio isoform X1 [Diaphorina citri]XP_026676259.1 protein pinocchio isoform X2 [Diaphorina citri]
MACLDGYTYTFMTGLTVNTPNMSLTSLTTMHPGCGLSHRSQSYNSISSLEENNFYNTEPVLSIEELRIHLNSCFTCGVSWYEDHVSLDCGECGGYSLERPCPMCEGRCRSQWKRDLTMSHTTGKAKWAGQCGLRSNQSDNTSGTSLSSSSGVEKITSS